MIRVASSRADVLAGSSWVSCLSDVYSVGLDSSVYLELYWTSFKHLYAISGASQIESDAVRSTCLSWAEMLSATPGQAVDSHTLTGEERSRWF